MKNLSIKIDEELEDFNRKYLELYQKVSDDLKSGIKVKDYLKSIKTRKEACHAVLYDECETIEEAIKSASKVQKLLEFEKEMNSEEVSSSKEIVHLGNKKFKVFSPIHSFPEGGKVLRYMKGKNTVSNEDEKKRIPVMASSKLYCYRCKEEGHKLYQCPYSDEELIQILTKRIKKEDGHVQKN